MASTQQMASKVVNEYPLPASSQTHEVVKVGEKLLLVSQQPNSCVVKVKLEASTGTPQEATQFSLAGTTSSSGLHGLLASTTATNAGKVWATLQFDSALLLLDPKADNMQTAPHVEKQIQLEGAPTVAGWGPHTLVEDGDDYLWVACKGSNYVLRVSSTSSSTPIVGKYPCSSRPIFVAVDSSGHVYSSLDLSSKILRLSPPDATSGETDYSSEEIDIDSTHGNTPVGLVAGPDGNVWFVLLGDTSGGTGTFARISSEDGTISWFQLSSTASASAGLIHLAFDPAYDNTTGLLRVWLLASSMASTTSVNAIFSVTLVGDRIVSEKTILIPTPLCKSHRVLVNGTSLFVTELGVSILAHVKGDAVWKDAISETSDAYSLWGFGSASKDIEYVVEQAGALVPAHKRRRKAT